MGRIPHTLIPCLGVSGVSEHPDKEGRHTSQSWLGLQSQATSASGRQLAAPTGRGAARGGTATMPIKAPTTSAAAFLPQPGPSGESLSHPPRGPHTPVTQFTLDLEFTVSPLFQPPLSPNADSHIFFAWVLCRLGPAEVCRCDYHQSL